MIKNFLSFFGRFRRDEDGVVTFEFVFLIPIYIMMLLAAFETAMLMTRQVLLDRGMDMAVRIVRLNTANPPTYDQLKTMICQGSGLIANCEDSLNLEMWRQDPRGTMTFDSYPDCLDRSLDVQPASTYGTGDQDEIMFLRACVSYKPFFPTATMGTALKDAAGEYNLVSTNLYVTEPR